MRGGVASARLLSPQGGANGRAIKVVCLSAPGNTLREPRRSLGRQRAATGNIICTDTFLLSPAFSSGAGAHAVVRDGGRTALASVLRGEGLGAAVTSGSGTTSPCRAEAALGCGFGEGPAARALPWGPPRSLSSLPPCSSCAWCGKEKARFKGCESGGRDGPCRPLWNCCPSSCCKSSRKPYSHPKLTPPGLRWRIIPPFSAAVETLRNQQYLRRENKTLQPHCSRKNFI